MTLHVDISHRFAGFSLDVAFQAGPGVTALFGASGAGKSTIINAVAGLVDPLSGAISLGDRRFFDAGANLSLTPQARNVGYVFQDGRLFPHMTVQKNLTFSKGYRTNRSARKLFDQVVELLQLAPLLTRKPNGLSGGERQRVAIGRALLTAPDVLLMDEPLASLGQDHKAEILPYLKTLAQEAKHPILYVSHSQAEVEQIADRVVLLSNGRKLDEGAPGDIWGDSDEVFQLRAEISFEGQKKNLKLGANIYLLPGYEHLKPGTVEIRFDRAGLALARLGAVTSAAISIDGKLDVGGTVTLQNQTITSTSLSDMAAQIGLVTGDPCTLLLLSPTLVNVP